MKNRETCPTLGEPQENGKKPSVPESAMVLYPIYPHILDAGKRAGGEFGPRDELDVPQLNCLFG